MAERAEENWVLALKEGKGKLYLYFSWSDCSIRAAISVREGLSNVLEGDEEGMGDAVFALKERR